MVLSGTKARRSVLMRLLNGRVEGGEWREETEGRETEGGDRERGDGEREGVVLEEAIR